MTFTDHDGLWLCMVAFLWGFTNPFIKRGSEGIEHIKKDGAIKQCLAEVKFLFFNWKYLVPFLINQSGSVLFYLTLASADLSVAVPVTNSLTFLFTSLAGYFLGEKNTNKGTYCGMVLVVAGVYICLSDPR